jgi:tetratricopeptide (TPR) repeat protein
MTADTSASRAHPALQGRRRRWVLAGAAVVVLVAGGAVGAWWWRLPAAAEPPMPGDIPEAEIRQAIENARRDVLDKPHSADAWGKLGMTLLAHEYDAEADRCFAEANRLDAHNARWTYARAQIALKHNPDNAVPFLRQAVAASDSWQEAAGEVRMQLAETLLARGESGEAEQILLNELGREPCGVRAAFNLGLLATMRDNGSAAIEYLTAAQAIPFARKKATAQLASLARASGDNDRATAYEKKLATLPDDSPWPDPFFSRPPRQGMASGAVRA